MKRRGGRPTRHRTDLERAQLDVIEAHKKCKALIDKARSRSITYEWILHPAREVEIALRVCRKTLKRECAAERMRDALALASSEHSSRCP